MANRDLRLQASMDDKASAPLKKLQDNLKKTGEQPGLKQLSKHLNGIQDGLTRIGKTAESGTSSLLAFGMGALGLVGVLDGMKDAALGVASAGKNLTNFTRQTGMSAQTLQEYQGGLKKFGIDAEQATQAIATLHNKAFLLRKGLNAGEFQFDPAFAAKLKAAKDANEELALSFAELQKYTDPNQRQYVSLKLFGDSSFAAVHSLSELKQAIKDFQATGAIMTPEQIAAGDKFADSMQKVQNALTGIKNNVGTVIADSLTKPLEDLSGYLAAHQDDIAKGIGQIGAAFGEFGKDLSELNGEVQVAMGYLKSLGELRDKIIGDQSHIVDASKAKNGDWVKGPFGTTIRKGSIAGALLGAPGDSPSATPPPGGYVEQPKTPYGSLTRDPSAHGDALSDQGRKFGEGVSDTLTKPMGGADQFGKQSAKSFWQWLSDAVVSPAKADTLAGVSATGIARAQGTYNGGLAIGGETGGGGGRRRAGGGQLYSNARDGGGAAIHARGNVARNQKLAYDALRGEGLSDQAAKVFVANVSSEALSNPGDVHFDSNGHGGGHTARGIVQWDPPRAAAIKKQFGKYPNEMSVAEQMRAAMWEINNSPRFAATRNALHGKGLSDAQMMDTTVRNYEAPANPGKDVQYRLRLLRGLPPSLSDAAKAAPNVSHPHTITPATATGTVNVNISGDRKDKVSVNSDGMFRKVAINRRFLNTQQEVG